MIKLSGAAFPSEEEERVMIERYEKIIAGKSNTIVLYFELLNLLTHIAERRMEGYRGLINIFEKHPAKKKVKPIQSIWIPAIH